MTRGIIFSTGRGGDLRLESYWFFNNSYKKGGRGVPDPLHLKFRVQASSSTIKLLDNPTSGKSYSFRCRRYKG